MPLNDCACKGIRTCLLCENKKNFNLNLNNVQLKDYIYCVQCGDKAYEQSSYLDHLNLFHCDKVNAEENINQNFDGYDFITIDGVYLQSDILTVDEEIQLVSKIDSFEWVNSQSGRRKQDFGPKINFKKQKLNFNSFNGLPELDLNLIEKIKRERLRTVSDANRFNQYGSDHDKTILNNFKTVEVCHLEYCPERGSSIDPHYDDFWIWGERLVTLNLLSATVVRLTLDKKDVSTFSYLCPKDDHQILIKCPPRSLLVLYGDARNRYQHSINRCDITSRRLAVTFRELPLAILNASDSTNLNICEQFFAKSQILIA